MVFLKWNSAAIQESITETLLSSVVHEYPPDWYISDMTWCFVLFCYFLEEFEEGEASTAEIWRCGSGISNL